MCPQCQNKLSVTTKIAQPMGPYQTGGNRMQKKKNAEMNEFR